MHPILFPCPLCHRHTVLGEWGNYFLFKYACTARCRKWEEQDVNFACIARIIREGGFKIAFMVRLSAIPGHLSTPVSGRRRAKKSPSTRMLLLHCPDYLER